MTRRVSTLIKSLGSKKASSVETKKTFNWVIVDDNFRNSATNHARFEVEK